MEKVNLPVENACEPNEEAHQPLGIKKGKKSKKQNITFADPRKDEQCSQSSISTYKDALSQPPSTMSHRQKLLWLLKRRGVGLWVQCDDCRRWRWLADVLDKHELPERWYCKNNPDASMAACSVAESPLRVREEEDLIHSEYSCGSLVWARLAGWPWWPAMVDDCPDTEQFYWLDGFSDIPTYYNVVFFDTFDTTRAWIAPESMKPFEENIQTFRAGLKIKKYKKRLEVALEQASDASGLSLTARLEKYSFVARYNGPINTPKKISKNVLKQHQKKLERKYQVPFPIESSDNDSESDEFTIQEKLKEKNSKELKRKNVIIVGTPKSKNRRVSKSEEAPRMNVIILGTPKRTNSTAAEDNTEKNINEVDNVTPKYKDGTAKSVKKQAKAKPTEKKFETNDPTATNDVITPSTNQSPRKLGDIIDYMLSRPKKADSEPASQTMNPIENEPATESTDALKEPNSMLAHCGSAKTTIAISNSTETKNLTQITTYIPESQSVSEPATFDDTDYGNTLAPSPKSDDFEF